jgi:flagellar hook protein FlgE
MMRSLFSAVSGLKSHQTAMDVIGNNVANVNTTAYKSSRVIFHDMYSQLLNSATAPTATSGGVNAKQVGLGVTISSIGMNMTDGNTQTTSNTLDLAIAGDGFFVVSDGLGGYEYTRNGAFMLDSQGYLITTQGNYVMGISEDHDPATDSRIDNGDTIVSGTTPLFGKVKLSGLETSGTTTYEYSNYAIDANGTITASVTTTTGGSSTTSMQNVGRLVLATFNNTAGLEKAGYSNYKESLNSGKATYDFANDGAAGSLKGGALEMSNVDLANELTSMIIVQRGYQANSRVITTSDTMLEELINLKR